VIYDLSWLRAGALRCPPVSKRPISPQQSVR
jgi:hypothetical protein